ncbi:hypothetical protein ACIF8T_32085 [Streptomyces sp. NPDC085946]|uniref:hypothetical protein n=1 Tax=Streptomyces sp. NPDC085946 TaxID=3365744 RepID=UPI0037D6CFCD
MTGSFPEVRAAAPARLPAGIGPDGEPVVRGPAGLRAARAALAAVFAEYGPAAPLTCCPSTASPAVTKSRLARAATGLEGLVLKRWDEACAAGSSPS